MHRDLLARAIVVALRVVLVGGAVLLMVTGCDASNDPDAFAVTFQNDLGRPVVLALCRSDHSAKCEHPTIAI